jgi:hypothetical protein
MPKPKLEIKFWKIEDGDKHQLSLSLRRVLGSRKIRRIAIHEDEIPELLSAIRKKGLDPAITEIVALLNEATHHSNACYDINGNIGTCVCSERAVVAREKLASIRERFGL